MYFWIVYLSQIFAVYMCAVIWVMQLLHYPIFSLVDANRFPEFCKKHTTTMGWLVGPVMILELLLATILVVLKADALSISNLVLNILLWMLTFFVSVRWHDRLAVSYDIHFIKQLVFTNWPRTFLWSVKFLLMIYWITLITQPASTNF